MKLISNLNEANSSTELKISLDYFYDYHPVDLNLRQKTQKNKDQDNSSLCTEIFEIYG